MEWQLSAIVPLQFLIPPCRKEEAFLEHADLNAHTITSDCDKRAPRTLRSDVSNLKSIRYRSDIDVEVPELARTFLCMDVFLS